MLSNLYPATEKESTDSSNYRVEAMESHAFAEPLRGEAMGLHTSRKSPILCEFPEIVDMFPRTLELEADGAFFDIFR